LGWSFGGTAAHAVACRLQADDECVELLAIMDAEPEADSTESAQPGLREVFLGLLDELGYDRRQLADVPLRHERIVAILRDRGSALAYLEPDRVSAIVDIFANNLRITRDYRP